MERPKVNININVDVKSGTTSNELETLMNDAVGISQYIGRNIDLVMKGGDEDDDPEPKQKPLSRHQKAVNENRRISKAIQYIDDCITSFEGEKTPIYSGAISNLKYLKKILLSS